METCLISLIKLWLLLSFEFFVFVFVLLCDLLANLLLSLSFFLSVCLSVCLSLFLSLKKKSICFKVNTSIVKHQTKVNETKYFRGHWNKLENKKLKSLNENFFPRFSCNDALIKVGVSREEL